MKAAARRYAPLAATAVLGSVTVAGFAPLSAFPLPFVTLAALLWLAMRATNAREAWLRGFAFGICFFLTGVSWVYVSLHDFGDMPWPLAALSTLLFCAYLAVYPALCAWLARRWRERHWLVLAAGIAAAWTLGEWVRGWLFTGFPWLALGYSQIPFSPLAGFAALGGIHAVTFLTVFGAALLGTALIAWPRVAWKLLWQPALVVAALGAAGAGLATLQWTTPQGAPLTISLLQGNVAQDLKWRPEQVAATLTAYLGLVETSRGRLVVLPETALPLYLDAIPDGYLERLRQIGAARDGAVLAGVPERADGQHYYNSVFSFGAAPTQRYRKSHLVPFGEFIPLRPLLGWIVSVLAIPLQDFSRGDADQQPLQVAGQRVALDICYEDVFGEEIIRQLPAATLLVNVSNVAWFGHSLAPHQHLQISQARALESGRPMLRATNTGMTAVIDPRGRLVAVAPQYETVLLEARVQGYTGATPYVRTGNLPMLVLCGVLVALCSVRRPRKSVAVA